MNIQRFFIKTIGILMSINSAIKQHQFTTISEEVTQRLVTQPLTTLVHPIVPRYQTNKQKILRIEILTEINYHFPYLAFVPELGVFSEIE